jgi:hypothetical protein
MDRFSIDRLGHNIVDLSVFWQDFYNNKFIKPQTTKAVYSTGDMPFLNL